jgi:hypothetical protein
VKRAKKAGPEQNFSSVARCEGEAQSIVDLPDSFGKVVGAGGNPGFEKLDEFFSKPSGVMVDGVVARGQKPSVVAAEGAELNTGDALAGFGISAPVSPIYGGIDRVAHDTKSCRIYKCGMCAVEKGENK